MDKNKSLGIVLYFLGWLLAIALSGWSLLVVIGAMINLFGVLLHQGHIKLKEVKKDGSPN